MKQRPLSSAAAVSIVAALVLAAIYWRQLWHLALTLAGLRIMWAVARHQLGMRKPRRNGKSLWEVAAASLGGYIVGRRGKDSLREAVASGADIQIHVKPRSSRYRA